MFPDFIYVSLPRPIKKGVNTMGKYRAESAKDAVKADARYWLYEEAETYTTGKNALRLYKDAGKLQIALPDYTKARRDYTTGKLIETVLPGKLSALDLEALREDPETLDWLIGILQGLK